MGCHFCADEAFAILAILGGIKFIPTWVRGIWGRRHKDCANSQHNHGDKS